VHFMTKHNKAYIALIYICLIWGTTYLAIRVAVMHYPAFLYAAIRQVISGLIIIAIGLAISRKVDLSKNNLWHQAKIGFLLIGIGNGFVSWGERFIPSGVAALICSMMPISSVLINLSIGKNERINAYIILGLLIGFGGVAVIFKDNIADLANRSYLIGMGVTFLATISWAYGSVINKKRTVHTNPTFNAGLQLLFGSASLMLFSPFMDSYENLNFFQPEVIWTMVYLIIFGSILAYTAYMYALKELPVGIVALYAYINPLVAVLLGYFILKEKLTWYTALAFCAIVAGVYIVNYGYRKQHKEKEIADFGDNDLSALPVKQTNSEN
jgi:drug/metabolite transporter (DMT)-like permease